MFADRYFAPRYFPNRYFPTNVQAEVPTDESSVDPQARPAYQQLGLTPQRYNALLGNIDPTASRTRTQMQAAKVSNPAGEPFDYTLQER